MEDIDEEADQKPASGGDTEDWKAKYEEAERQRKGMYEDLKAERENRIAMQRNLESINQGAIKARNDDDPNTFIQELQTKGKNKVLDTAKEVVNPVVQRISYLESKLDEDRAMEWIARQESSRTGKMLYRDDVEDVKKEILRTARENNLLGLSWNDGARASYKIWRKTEQEKEKDEGNRDKSIARNATETTRVFPRTESRIYKASEVREILKGTNDPKVVAELNVAFREGRIKE